MTRELTVDRGHHLSLTWSLKWITYYSNGCYSQRSPVWNIEEYVSTQSLCLLRKFLQHSISIKVKNLWLRLLPYKSRTKALEQLTAAKKLSSHLIHSVKSFSLKKESTESTDLIFFWQVITSKVEINSYKGYSSPINLEFSKKYKSSRDYSAHRQNNLKWI